ncbi:hypothetical protein O4214_05320 [Rhodococcus erythropolis]|uniref:hypothetical protein n=1 Tax=Rhodococcus erythropolis TaxID=1833 RepID=UPI001E49FFCF|nr:MULTISPECIES: hypothetical protein [Rhodococcus erythropolis group]MCD2104338.1 hypothetical protein [Rhodococcus qingshengii]MCZ4523393.1 hypothetical protein [Rhodococcus erythropolis]
MSCLDEMWSPVVDKALDGGNLVTPHVDMRFYGDDAPILCGEGAEDTHPSQANNRMWFDRGMQEGLSSCDTWSAPESEIR